MRYAPTHLNHHIYMLNTQIMKKKVKNEDRTLDCRCCTSRGITPALTNLPIFASGPLMRFESAQQAVCITARYWKDTKPARIGKIMFLPQRNVSTNNIYHHHHHHHAFDWRSLVSGITAPLETRRFRYSAESAAMFPRHHAQCSCSNWKCIYTKHRRFKGLILNALNNFYLPCAQWKGMKSGQVMLGRLPSSDHEYRQPHLHGNI